MSADSVDDLWRIEFETHETSFRAKHAILNALEADARIERIRKGLWFLPGRTLKATLDVAADTSRAAAAVAFEDSRATMQRLRGTPVSTTITESTSDSDES